MCTLIALGLAAAGARAATPTITLIASNSVGSALVSNTVTCSIYLTNQSAAILYNVRVTNLFSSAANITSWTPTNNVEVTSDSFTFYFPVIYINRSTNMTVKFAPSDLGAFTNTVIVASTSSGTNLVFTNLTVTVTNVSTDLSVILTRPKVDVFTNDWMTYTVTVTNLGPTNTSGILVSNYLPAGVGYKYCAPANLSPMYAAGSNVVFKLGNLPSGSATNLLLTVQTTNAGNLTFNASVRSTVTSDPNTTNNTGSVTIPVGRFFTNQLEATFLTNVQVFNAQVGHMEQPVQLTNKGPNTATAIRVVVTGLTTNLLFNATGTNDGNPFVVYNGSLGAGASVDLLMQYYVRSRRQLDLKNTNLIALAVSRYDFAPASNLTNGVTITDCVKIPPGMLLGFPSTNGLRYRVIYSDNAQFTNAQLVQPPLQAAANWTCWIDYGPPGTITHPTNTLMRFYKVIREP